MSISKPTKPYTFTNITETADATKVNADFDTIYSAVNASIDELNNADGSKASLTARMAVSINDDGTLKSSVTAGGEWIDPDLSPVYTSTTTFTVAGDQTDIYLADRRLKIVLAGGTSYTEIVSSAFTTLTTVTIADAILTDPITSVEHGLLTPSTESTTSMPKTYAGDLIPDTLGMATNNVYMQQYNAAQDTLLDIIKINASDRVELGGTIEAPTVQTGSFTAVFPTNGLANSKIMLGDSNTIAWFYLNAAPPGWKVLATGADTVIAVAGGTDAYNVAGGSQAGTWTISGVTVDAHSHAAGTLSAGSHNHQWYNQVSSGVDDQTYNSGGSGVVIPGASKTNSSKHLELSIANDSAPNDCYTSNTTPSMSGSTASDAGGTATTSAGTWRTKASVGKLFQLDTA